MKRELPFDWDEGLVHLARKDRKLAALIERSRPLRMELAHTQSLFHALCEAIVYQQLNGNAAATIFSRVRAIYAPKRFPTPHELASTRPETLRKAGLSNAKTLAMQDLARRTAAGELPTLAQVRRMPDDEIVERLTVVRGIGPWTVHMLLMFRLGRPDVLPVLDYGVRKGFQLTYKLRDMPTPVQLAAHAERWRPYRSVGAWHMWRALEK